MTGRRVAVLSQFIALRETSENHCRKEDVFLFIMNPDNNRVIQKNLENMF